jgi:hypothetical protein
VLLVASVDARPLAAGVAEDPCAPADALRVGRHRTDGMLERRQGGHGAGQAGATGGGNPHSGVDDGEGGMGGATALAD